MIGLGQPITVSIPPDFISINKEELKRLKKSKLISTDLYIYWALVLSFGYNDFELSLSKIEEFCEDWIIVDARKIVFVCHPSQVTEAISKLSRKDCGKNNINFGVQLSLDLTIKEDQGE